MTTSATTPSGTQYELRLGEQRAIVVEVGGGLREYVVDDQPVLDGYPLDKMADGGRGQPLLPWPNRLGDGQYQFDGETLQLPIDEVGRRHAIHGLTRWLNWTLVDQADDRLLLAQRIYPRPGYPFTLDLQIEYALDHSGLTVRTTAHNVGQRKLPFGAGQHPYFTVGGALVDSAKLKLPANSRLELDDERRLPTGRPLAVDTTEFDFRQSRRIGTFVIDECFTDIIRDSGGRAQVVVTDPASQRSVVVWMAERYRYIQAFTGDTLAPERRRRGLAIEPMTCPPDAFRTGTDLIILQPDESCTLEWGVSSVFDKQFTSL
jgi:aldose 1-epimerase